MNEARERIEEEVLRVATKSNPNAVAGTLADVIREKGYAITQTIGAGSLNQAVKAIAIAMGFLAPSGIDIIMRPRFADITVEGQAKTAIQILIETKERARTVNERWLKPHK